MSGARPSSRCHLSEDFLLLQSSCRSPFLGDSPTMPKVSELERSRHVRTVCASVSSSTAGKESDSTSMCETQAFRSFYHGKIGTRLIHLRADFPRVSGQRTSPQTASCAIRERSLFRSFSDPRAAPGKDRFMDRTSVPG